MTLQKKATIVSSSVAAILTIIKLVVGIASGSVAVLASAVDSILDMLVSLFNYFAINNSEKPADEHFNYGRSKIEALACVIEGTIICMSGIFLLYEAVKKAINGEVSSYLTQSLYVMIVSLVITILLVVYLNKIAKKTNNMVIKADALHYKTDVFTNIAVLASLLLVKFTGYEIIDVLIGGAIAIFIMFSAYSLIKEGLLVLLDSAVEKEIVDKIKYIINDDEKINTYHLLKTREAGNQTFVDVHLVFDCLMSLIDAHKIVDEVEEKIIKIDSKKDWIITIHMDPYDDFAMDNKNNNN